MKRKIVVAQICRLIKRDGLACYYCGIKCDPAAPINSNLSPSRDHLIARSKGGKSRMDNLVLACRKCNCAKGQLSAGEFMQK